MPAKKDRTAAIEKAVAHLTERIAVLESKLESTPPLPAISPVDMGLVELLRTREGGPYEGSDSRGAVVYGGAVVRSSSMSANTYGRWNVQHLD